MDTQYSPTLGYHPMQLLTRLLCIFPLSQCSSLLTNHQSVLPDHISLDQLVSITSHMEGVVDKAHKYLVVSHSYLCTPVAASILVM